MTSYEFEADLFLWEGDAAWHFVAVPTGVSDDIKERTDDRPMRRGFGSVRVEVTCGDSTWRTSVFPDTKRGAYLLPVKKDVRRAEGIGAGDVATFTLRLLDA